MACLVHTNGIQSQTGGSSKLGTMYSGVGAHHTRACGGDEDCSGAKGGMCKAHFGQARARLTSIPQMSPEEASGESPGSHITA